LARDSPGSWVVIDGYRFGSLFQQEIADSETGVVCIDDNAHLEHYFGHILLNQNIHAAPGMYDGRIGSSMKLLLGPDFCLLRQEFASTPAPPRDHDRVKRLVVTFGGSDPAGLTPRVLRILAPLAESDWEVRVVLGSGSACSAEVADLAATLMKGRIQLLVQPGSMRDVFAWADIAISAAGSTLYELMYMGVPTIAVVVAENQKMAQVALERSGTMLTLPDVERIGVELPSCLERLCQDRALRVHMSAAGRRMVDGAGAARVSDVILEQMNG
jgi:spore coat polysaccharide biosynthesis predicted glycosyltransferase SpsG